MPIFKRCDRCHKRLKPGTTCDCVKTARREQRAGKETEKEYGTTPWKVKRDAVKQSCGNMDALLFFRSGQVVPADMVHHIIPLKERRDLWLDDNNLIPLSDATHAEVERVYESGEESKRQQQNELRAALEYTRCFVAGD